MVGDEDYSRFMRILRRGKAAWPPTIRTAVTVPRRICGPEIGPRTSDRQIQERYTPPFGLRTAESWKIRESLYPHPFRTKVRSFSILTASLTGNRNKGPHTSPIGSNFLSYQHNLTGGGLLKGRLEEYVFPNKILLETGGLFTILMYRPLTKTNGMTLGNPSGKIMKIRGNTICFKKCMLLK